MQRRKFVETALVASALPLTALASQASSPTSSLEKKMNEEKEVYEIRTYEIKFGSNKKLLISYLKEALQPALRRFEVEHFLMFTELGNSDPTKIWLLITYPNFKMYFEAQNLWKDEEYVNASAEYHKNDRPIFNRYTSWLLSAFEGMPRMKNPIEDAGLFELRTYEGFSEDAVRRKIQMFNKEEIVLFEEVGLHPVFFGEMISGPYRPCLTYMINFKDMKEHDENWKKFIKHPAWNEMKAKEEYANTVSNIRKVFLKPM